MDEGIGPSQSRGGFFAATKLFTVGAAGDPSRPTAPPMNNFG